MTSKDTNRPDVRSSPQARKRLRLVAVLLGVVCVATGAVLVSLGRSHHIAVHAQPLPEHPFHIDPSRARALPAAPTVHRPQPGSPVTSCAGSGRSVVLIPSLCIVATLQPTHSDNGELIIPQDVRRVGLDTESASLDARAGSTVIAGHVDNANQGTGSFFYLYQLVAGAEITVLDASGAATKWRVFAVAAVQKSALPQDIFRRDGARQLVLVTCGGRLLKTPHGNTYEDNVLAYATPERTA